MAKIPSSTPTSPAEATTVQSSPARQHTPPALAVIVAACFDRLALRQRARMLGRLLASVGPLALAVVGGGAFAKYAIFARLPEVPVSLEDAALATSAQVQEIVRYIEQSNPQLFNLLGLLARDTTTIAALGASIAALTVHTLANRREPRPPVIKPQVSAD